MTNGTTVPDRARHQFSSALQSALSLADVGEAFMSTATAVLPADAFGMYRFDNGWTSPIDVLAYADGDFLREYEEYGRADDPVLQFVVEQQRPIDSSRVVSAEQWESSGARTALGGAGLRHSLEAPLVASGTLIGTINFARRDENAAFDAAELASARLVSEQLELAIERALRFESTGRQTSMLERVLDRLPHGVIVTDLDGFVLFRNRVARNKDFVRHELHDVAGPESVESSVAEAIGEFRLGKRVHTASLRDPASQNQLVVKSYTLGELHGAAVSLVYDCGAQEESRRLPAWDVLSPREQEIAQLVSKGLTTKQIAERAFVTENTVKQHLKRIFAKTDVRNRAELVQLIWAAGGTPAEAVSA